MADTYYTSVSESTAVANKRHLAVFNRTGSGKVLVVYRITAMGTPQQVGAGLTVGLVAVRLTSNPTGGTTGSFVKAKPDVVNVPGYISTPNVPGQIMATVGHTTGSIEANPFGCGSCNSDETSNTMETVIYEAPIDGSQQIECPESYGFEVRQLTLPSSGGAITIVAVIGLRTAP